MSNTLQVGPVPYRLEFIPDLRDDDNRTLRLHGQVKYGLCVIQIDANDAPALQRITILHEAIHVLLENAGIEHGENVPMTLSFGMAQLLKDNPWLGQPVEATE